jgi:hypothetical protein
MVCHFHLLSLFIWQKLQIRFSNGLLKDLPNFEELLSRGAARANLRALRDLPLREEAHAAPFLDSFPRVSKSPCSPYKSPCRSAHADEIESLVSLNRSSLSRRRLIPHATVVIAAPSSCLRRPRDRPPSSSARPPSIVVRAAVVVRAVVLCHRLCGLHSSSSARLSSVRFPCGLRSSSYTQPSSIAVRTASVREGMFLELANWVAVG